MQPLHNGNDAHTNILVARDMRLRVADSRFPANCHMFEGPSRSEDDALRDVLQSIVLFVELPSVCCCLRDH